MENHLLRIQPARLVLSIPQALSDEVWVDMQKKELMRTKRANNTRHIEVNLRYFKRKLVLMFEKMIHSIGMDCVLQVRQDFCGTVFRYYLYW